jgi:peptidyl-prolyl cis-trans isomerase A (cyclophilin A)
VIAATMLVFALLAGLASRVRAAEALPVVVLETALGRIEIEVETGAAPKSSASFLAYVDAGLYDGAAFYRTVRADNDNGYPVISVVQGGVLDEGDALPPVAHESTADTSLRHTDGTISLARAEPGTASGAAFFICIDDQPSLDFGGLRNRDGLGFAAFGRVIRGMDVIRTIHAMDANGPADSDYTRGQMLTDFVTIRKAYRD